jgi:hypothetical protein
MSTSERVTWETCPTCGRSAAVGWLDRIPVEFDCPSGCQVTGAEFVRRTRGDSGVPAGVARWAGAGRPD